MSLKAYGSWHSCPSGGYVLSWGGEVMLCYCDDHKLFLCSIIISGLLDMLVIVMCRVDIEDGGRGVEEGNRILNEEVGAR